MPPESLDQPTVVRPESSFDIAALAAWLRERVPALEGTPELLQFGRGFSNLTYLVRFAGREFVIRRAPPGINIKSAHDMGREFRILSALAPVWSKVPRPIAHCDDASVIGTPFYVMERVRGVILRAQEGPARPGGVRDDGLVLDEADHAPSLRVGVRHARRDSPARLARRRAGRARQARGVRRAAGEGLGRAIPQGEDRRRADRRAPRAWLEENRPSESGATLVHNDFKYDNVVLAPDLSGVTAVLDWEMATIGDPLMDLGTALGYWIDPGDRPLLEGRSVFGPTNMPGQPLAHAVRGAVVARDRPGRVERRLLLRVRALQARGHLAAALQALRRRAHDREERYGFMLGSVRSVTATALVAVDKGRIDRLAE